MKAALIYVVVVLTWLVVGTIASLDDKGCLMAIRNVASDSSLSHDRGRYTSGEEIPPEKLRHTLEAQTVCEYGSLWTSHLIMGFKDGEPKPVACPETTKRSYKATELLENLAKFKFGTIALGLDPDHYMTIEKFTDNETPYYRVYQQYLSKYSMKAWANQISESKIDILVRERCLAMLGSLKRNDGKVVEDTKLRTHMPKLGLEHPKLFKECLKNQDTTKCCQQDSVKGNKQNRNIHSYCMNFMDYHLYQYLFEAISQNKESPCDDESKLEHFFNPDSILFKQVHQKFGGGKALTQKEIEGFMKMVEKNPTMEYTGVYATNISDLKRYCIHGFNDLRCTKEAVADVKQFTTFRLPHKNPEPAFPVV